MDTHQAAEVHINEVSHTARVFVDDVKGKRVAWLDKDGTFGVVTCRADAFEVPRVDVNAALPRLEDIGLPGFTVKSLVAWGADESGVESVGAVLVEDDQEHE